MRNDADAPFRRYKTTEAEAYNDGLKSGLSWLEKNKWIPGGPFVSQPGYNKDADWIAFCEKTKVNHAAWLRGWHDGRNKQHGSTM